MEQLETLDIISDLCNSLYDACYFDYITWETLEGLNKKQAINLMIDIIDEVLELKGYTIERGKEREILANHYYFNFEYKSELLNAIAKYIILAPIATMLKTRYGRLSEDQLSTIIYLFTNTDTISDCIHLAVNEAEVIDMKGNLYSDIIPYLQEI